MREINCPLCDGECYLERADGYLETCPVCDGEGSVTEDALAEMRLCLADVPAQTVG